jgi:serralysin
MRARHVIAFAALFGIIAAAPSPAYAGHHLWKLKQLFSNASGSVQFAQLFVTENGESGVGPFTLTASGHTFNFVSNLPAGVPTANTWILVATPGFASAPGAVPPDYVMPANFFSTGGGTINYAGVDIWNYGTVPSDGVHSLMRDGSTPVNSVINFSGQSGSLNLAALATPAPALTSWGIVALVGALLLIGSGLLRRRENPA